jgi:NADP-dependent 3-hydroxy acid dehydrogenase YdfG
MDSALDSMNDKDMAEKKLLLVTGAGRGMGVDLAKAALAAGHTVHAGFEEITADDFPAQVETNLFGPRAGWSR